MILHIIVETIRCKVRKLLGLTDSVYLDRNGNDIPRPKTSKEKTK
jgi:hypothetical protein